MGFVFQAVFYAVAIGVGYGVIEFLISDGKTWRDKLPSVLLFVVTITVFALPITLVHGYTTNKRDMINTECVNRGGEPFKNINSEFVCIKDATYID